MDDGKTWENARKLEHWPLLTEPRASTQIRVMVRSNRNSLEGSSVNNGIIVSGIARKLPPLCRPCKQLLTSSGSRRKLMSAVDYERLKIQNEVEQLRESLKVVQEERKELTRRASLPPLSSKVRVTSKNRGSRRSSMDLHSS
ncbi:hypothetical protein Rs2_21917 [Raphanus sativus]|nr:hypothetical protein Rs2_21917 [Raphanus sativus]